MVVAKVAVFCALPLRWTRLGPLVALEISRLGTERLSNLRAVGLRTVYSSIHPAARSHGRPRGKRSRSIGRRRKRGSLPWARRLVGASPRQARRSVIVLLRVGGLGRGQGLRSPGVDQEDVTDSDGAPFGGEILVRNGPQQLSGAEESRSDPCPRQSPQNGPRRGPRPRFVADPGGGVGGTPPG